MSGAFLLYNGVSKRFLPKVLSSCSDSLILNRPKGPYKTINRHYAPFAPTKLSSFENECKILTSTSLRYFNVKLPFKRTGAQKYLTESVRQFGFCAVTVLPIKKCLNSNSIAGKDMLLPSTCENQHKLQNTARIFQQDLNRYYSTPEKPGGSSYPPTPTGLADEIMQARVNISNKDSSQGGQESHGEDTTKEENPKGPKPLSKWQRRGYIAFVVLLGGGLIANAVIFGE